MKKFEESELSLGIELVWILLLNAWKNRVSTCTARIESVTVDLHKLEKFEYLQAYSALYLAKSIQPKNYKLEDSSIEKNRWQRNANNTLLTNSAF